MRRMLFTALASAALITALPAVAMARDGDGRRDEHHHRHHRAHVHHRRVRHERRGREHDFPPAKAGDAGTVQSFNNGVLVITLSDGSTVSGKVTNGTELRCEAPEMSTDDQDPGGSDGGDRGGDHGGNGDHGDRCDDRGEDGQMCAPGALRAGALVHEAELRITTFGAFWEEVELVRAS
jgi:hypothetical protein